MNLTNKDNIGLGATPSRCPATSTTTDPPHARATLPLPRTYATRINSSCPSWEPGRRPGARDQGKGRIARTHRHLPKTWVVEYRPAGRRPARPRVTQAAALPPGEMLPTATTRAPCGARDLPTVVAAHTPWGTDGESKPVAPRPARCAGGVPGPPIIVNSAGPAESPWSTGHTSARRTPFLDPAGDHRRPAVCPYAVTAPRFVCPVRVQPTDHVIRGPASLLGQPGAHRPGELPSLDRSRGSPPARRVPLRSDRTTSADNVNSAGPRRVSLVNRARIGPATPSLNRSRGSAPARRVPLAVTAPLIMSTPPAPAGSLRQPGTHRPGELAFSQIQPGIAARPARVPLAVTAPRFVCPVRVQPTNHVNSAGPAESPCRPGTHRPGELPSLDPAGDHRRPAVCPYAVTAPRRSCQLRRPPPPVPSMNRARIGPANSLLESQPGITAGTPCAPTQ